MLNEKYDKKTIEQIYDYFNSLTGNAINSITVSKVVTNTSLKKADIISILSLLKEKKFLSNSFTVRCPDCGLPLLKSEEISGLPAENIMCYNCEEEKNITTEDIEVVYSICNSEVFIEGQQIDVPAHTVVQEDSLFSLLSAGNINQILFHPSESDYERLNAIYNSVMTADGKTKDIGDTLEYLTSELFNLCDVFQGAGIKTKTNQIDCYVRNKLYIDVGILKTIGARFFIECKNEKKTPKGDYMSKLHSIISTTNASNECECIKFSIIVSKNKGPSTFRELANKYYLKEKVIIIAICGSEIKKLIDNRGNLLEMIERKCTEVMLDSTSDLINCGIYEN